MAKDEHKNKTQSKCHIISAQVLSVNYSYSTILTTLPIAIVLPSSRSIKRPI